MNKKGQEGIIAGIIITIIIVGIIISLAFGLPRYNVWQKEMSGKAQLAEAEWNRQISIKEAEANLESEKFNAQSEIERAKGVAESNKIIGEGLKNNEEYIHYLWVKGLREGNQVIYVPTEGNVPIMEAGRLK
jgi:hypothetical protein